MVKKKALLDTFLPRVDRERIEACVRQVEGTTSGEIVPMVVPSSHPYPLASLSGALGAGLLLAVLATAYVSLRRAWGGLTLVELWVFPAVFGLFTPLFYELMRLVPALRRLFIRGQEMAEEVEEAALSAFYRRGLSHTRDHTGILIFISVFERRVQVLADSGINAKVPPEAWQEVADLIVAGIRRGRQGEAICQAVKRCGELLGEHFPRRRDDRDELQNLIVEE